MAEVVLRAGVPSDVSALRALGEAVVPATYAPINHAYAAMMLEEWWSPAGLAVVVDRSANIVAEHDHQVVGFATLGRHDDREVMWKLYVHPAHQRHGIGSRLLAGVIDLVQGDHLWLENVDGNDSARSFYLAHGFEEMERVPFSPWPDDIWMRKVVR